MNKYKDHWVHKINDEDTLKSTGNMGFAVHLVTKDSVNEIQKFLGFRDYCNEFEHARKRYSDIKREGSILSNGKPNSIMGYSIAKA